MEVVSIMTLCGIVIQIILLIIGLIKIKQHKIETVHMQEQLTNSMHSLQESVEFKISNVDSMITNFKNDLKENSYVSKQQIASLKLTNYIDAANGIYQSQEHTYENEFFIQEVGHCKIVKIIDKQDQSVTNVYYNENEKKSYTETFNENLLTYSAHYAEDKLTRGCEYDVKANLLFEYFYNEIGEVIKKVEYLYAEDGTLEKTLNTTY